MPADVSGQPETPEGSLLAPSLVSRGLTLPQELVAPAFKFRSIFHILLGLGLTDAQANFLLCITQNWKALPSPVMPDFIPVKDRSLPRVPRFLAGVVPPWIDFEPMPVFQAVPRDGGMPIAFPKHQMLVSSDPADSPDVPQWGILNYYVRILLIADKSRFLKDAGIWFDLQKRLFKLTRIDKRYRDDKRFVSELVVYSLTRSGRWAVEDIEVQLKHFNLYPICGSKKSDPKAGRRKIVHRVGRLLSSVRDSPLFTQESQQTGEDLVG